MKTIFVLAFICLSTSIYAQDKPVKESKPDPERKIYVLDASCGQCQFKLQGKGCDLAVKFEDKAYFVDGTTIDEHGDAHAKDGFCEAIRKAAVQGELKGDRFKVTYFKLIKTGEKSSSNKPGS